VHNLSTASLLYKQQYNPTMKTNIKSLLLIIILSVSSFVPLGGRIPVVAKKGMVVSASTIASEVGCNVLKSGGNAIDAAVATAFALAVTWPAAGNIGGGGFLVYMDKNSNATTIDFREKAPLAAHIKMYLDENGNVIKDLHRVGVLSSGIPGTVAGLYLAHSKYGKLPWKKLVEPAIQLASKGISFTYALNEQSNYHKEVWKNYPSTAKVMLKNSKDVYECGETWKQPDLARTLTRIRDNGRDGFYKGETAEKLTAFMKVQGGIITQPDLDQYEAIERKPIVGTYRDYTVYTMAPPSSGGVALVEMLNILEGYDLKALGYKSADYIHVLKEAMQRAYADRAEYLGDPDFNPDIPLERLTSKEYAKRLRENIKMDIASVSDSSRFGQIYDGSDNTTHLSVVDNEGNAVSMTYTIDQSYGSQVVAEGLGFFLNDEMGDFNIVPDVTNSRGQIGTKPNLIAPGKRMLSSMIPTILAKDGKPVIIIGTPGGRTIINIVLQVILNIVDHNMNIAEAIEAPRIHHQWLPDRISFEPFSISKDTQVKLIERGHKLSESWGSFGAAMGIMIDHKKGIISGAADSRSPDGGAVGY
jgi:gamma-glutamyltranspeptidase / glutathione hydrolase